MPVDPRAHRDQAVGEVDDLGLARGVVEHGLALGEARPPSAGSRSRRPRPAGSAIAAPFRPPRRAGVRCSRRRCSISAPIGSRPLRCRSTGRAPMAQPPGSETRASPVARQQRPQHQHRGAHLAHEVVGRRRSQVIGAARSDERCGRPRRRVARPSTPCCCSSSLMVVMSASRGTLLQRQRLVGQQRGGHQRQGGVLGAADGDARP